MAKQTPRQSSGPCHPGPAHLNSHLADVIHDEVLQSIGVSILQADLCRRLWADRREAEAGVEMDNLVQALDRAVEALRHVLSDLRVAAGT